ncbi:degenerin deg-1-like [Branchiostoma floridae]|uniref:Degenerin deg-1-like n=1 Tax=Branchiostoma floridae TaxID=7739 RepID=A0A9J7N9P2_BRAFL|nr:degenerin deg-1-like [Branchiostoma floridae]
MDINSKATPVDDRPLPEDVGETPARLWSNFREETTAHGIPKTVTAKSRFRRIVWGIIFLASFAYFLYNFSLMLQRYFSYPVTTSIDIKFASLPFPAVTVCNLNPVRASKLPREFRGFLGVDSDDPSPTSDIPRKKRDVLPTPAPTESGNVSTSQSNSSSADGYYYEYEYEYDYYDYDEGFEMEQNFTIMIAHKNETQRQQLGHQKKDFIQKCTYNGRPCSGKNFVQFLDEKYGNCFTFNKGITNNGSKIPLRNVTQPGPLYGLQVLLYVEQDEYVPVLTETSGVRVLINTQADRPFPALAGFSVATGFSSSVGLTLTEIERLGGHYGDCTDGTGKRYDLYGTTYAYSSVLCQKTCYQRAVVRDCLCADAGLPVPDGTAVCDPANRKTAECLKETRDALRKDLLDCDCPEACKESVFGQTFGFSELPSASYKFDLHIDQSFERAPAVEYSGYKKQQRSLEQFIEELKKMDNPKIQKLSAEEASVNFVELTIYFEGLYYDKISQSPAYEVINLLGDIGGQLGLWMGVSVMTVLEFFEFIVDLFLPSKKRNGDLRNEDIELGPTSSKANT